MNYQIDTVKITNDQYKGTPYTAEPVGGIYDGNALLGKVVQFPVVVEAFTYRVRKDGEFQDKDFEQYQLPVTCLIDITLQKNIVVTAIQGRNGTVKELISNGDYRVRIRGALVGDGQAYPMEDVQKLQELAAVPAAFPVSGWLFEVLGISYLVLENLDFPSFEGMTNTQPFTMDCISDNTPDIQLIEQFEGL